MRVATLLAAVMVMRMSREIRAYYQQKAQRAASATSTDLDELQMPLPDHVKTFVKKREDERALVACRVGTKISLVQASSGSSGSKQRECFLQLSECITLIRWSWRDYLLIDEIVDVRSSTDKPLHITITYSPFSSSANRTLSIVCKTLRHAEQWVRSLRLLRRSYAQFWGLPAHEMTRLKSAFKVASHGHETLTISQQQTFFAYLNRWFTKDELAAYHRILPSEKRHRHSDVENADGVQEERLCQARARSASRSGPGYRHQEGGLALDASILLAHHPRQGCQWAARAIR